MYETLMLSALLPGDSGYVTEINARSDMARRLADLGLIRGTRVTCELTSPAGDPRAYRIRGTLIALRQEDADRIWMERLRGGVGA